MVYKLFTQPRIGTDCWLLPRKTRNMLQEFLAAGHRECNVSPLQVASASMLSAPYSTTLFSSCTILYCKFAYLSY